MDKRGAYYTVSVLVIIFIFVLLFSAVLFVPGENELTGRSIVSVDAYGCYDSDEGSDIYTAGTVVFNEGAEVSRLADRCLDNKRLLEYDCEDEGVAAKEIVCENLCLNRACG